MAEENFADVQEELEQLRIDNKKLKRELKRITRDNELLRVANDQAGRTQSFIQKETNRQVFFNEQLLKAAPYIILLSDVNLKMGMASDALLKFSSIESLKFSPDTDIRDALKGVLSSEDLSTFYEQCMSVISDRSPVSYIIRTEKLTEHFDFSISISPMIDDDNLQGLVILFVDMTEIIDAKEKAELADEAKSSFLANMSHEIRTPINAVLGMDEMILRESKEDSIKAYAQDIRSAGTTLLALINEILDFSKVEEGKMEIVPTQYELAYMLNDVVNMVRNKIVKKSLEFKLIADETMPHHLYGDDIRIKQCIVNLLNNSVKYTERGTMKLEIGYRYINKDKIYLEIHVSDTGIGMKEEDIERLFSPFVRIDEKKNRNIEGTGLGMTITKQLLELMNSSLSVDSVYGKGSDFMFAIEQGVSDWEPMGDFSERFNQNKKEEKHEEYRVLFKAPKARILTVDDTEMNLTVFKNLLKQTDIEIDTAISGFEALEAVEMFDYDIIFIDHMMPQMDGIETLEKMKEMDNYSKSVHIALTANAISGSREKYMEAGFDDYLSKPVSGEVLEKMVYKYLPKEKIEEDTQSAASIPIVNEEYTVTKEGRVLPEWITNNPPFDIEAGIKNCGSEDGYLSVLKLFHESFEKNMKELTGYYDSNDWPNFTVKVHALKSSTRIIGNTELSDLALKLELAGGENDIQFIKDHYEELLKGCDQLDSFLKGFDKDANTLPEMPKGLFIESLKSIRQYAEEMDYGMVDMLLNVFKDYSFESADNSCINEINEALLELDWDKIVEASDKRLSLQN